MKWQEVKAKAKAKAEEIKTRAHWIWVQYDEQIVLTGVVVLPIAVKVVDSISKAVKASNEEHHRLLTDYDPSMGWYNELKRPLTPSDKQMILKLRDEGYNQTEALLRLNLLK